MRYPSLFLICLLLLGGAFLAVDKIKAADTATFELGDLVKSDSDSAVYLIGKNNKRFVYPNEDVFYSWNSDFSKVQTVSSEVLAGYQLAGNITIKPGSKLVKITTDPKVYAVARGAKLEHLASEAIAQELYGVNWAKRVVDIPDYLFTDYVLDDLQPLINMADYPDGAVIQYANDNQIYLIKSVPSKVCIDVMCGEHTCACADVCIDVFFNKSSFYANAFFDQDIVISNKVYPACGNGSIRGVGDGYLSVPSIANPDAHRSYIY